MERRTTLGIAGGVTLVAAAAAAVIGVNLGLMSDSSASTGPGTFEPVAAVSNSTAPRTTEEVRTIYVDENGNPIDPSAGSVTGPSSTSGAVTTVPRASGYDDHDSDDHDHDSDAHDDRGGEREGGHDDDD